MHSERFFETVARTAPCGRCCDRPFNAKTPRVLNGNGCPAEAPYGCFLPDLTRFGTYRHPNPLNARGVQEISYPILGAQVENHFSHSNAATKRASLRREWAIRAPGYSESQRAEHARMQAPPPRLALGPISPARQRYARKPPSTRNAGWARTCVGRTRRHPDQN